MAPKWSRNDEQEADQLAVYMISRVPGWDVAGGHRFFDWMETQTSGRAAKIGKAMAAGVVGGGSQALVSRGSVASVAVSTASSVIGTLVKGSGERHYHDGAKDRSQLSAQAAERFGHADTEAAALMASLDAPPPTAAAPVAPSASKPARGRGHGPRTSAVQVAAVRLDPWEKLKASRVLVEVNTAARVRRAPDAKAAAALCPARPISAQLALACGIAQAGVPNSTVAKPLLAQAFADRRGELTPGDCLDISAAQLSMNDSAAALSVLRTGEDRYGDPTIYAREVALRTAAGDAAGAADALQRCGVLGKDAAQACKQAAEVKKKA